MGKEEISTTKYLIHAQINANGIVEKPDVVGAIFGQTEGQEVKKKLATTILSVQLSWLNSFPY